MGLSPFPEAAREIDPDTPFRILICGDFSGRANRGVRQIGRELAARKPVLVDRDNFDEVMIHHGVKLENLLTGSDGHPVALGVRELDDFHPDRLFEKVALFESLRSLRRRLLNRATFDQAAEEVRGWAADSPQTNEPSPPAAAVAASASENVPGNVLERLFAETGLVARETRTDWNRFIQETVAKYAVRGADPQQEQLVACVDAAVSHALRAILHHPEFQRIEAAWRGLSLLIRRLETDASLQLHLLDVSKEELAADLAGDDLATSGLYKILVEKTVGTPGAKPWAAIVGDYVFGSQSPDLNLLSRLAQLVAAAGSPLLAAAHGSVAGCPNPRETPELDDWQDPAGSAWQTLRQLPASRYVSLVWPRFLLRTPYGAQTSPTNSIKFEEFSGESSHEHLLWGNGAFLEALVLGEAFVESGWGLDPDTDREISGLPWFAAPDSRGDNEMHPCGELWLRTSGAERLESVGLTPLYSVLGVDAVRLGGIVSLPGKALSGRWG